MKTLLLLCFAGLAFGGIDKKCLDCICKLEGCEKQIGKCRMDMGSLSCGPYQIKEIYWKDAGKPGKDWKSCAKQMDCGRKATIAYTGKYGPGCNNGKPTCVDYLRIHNGGPSACKPGTKQYKFTEKYVGRSKTECKL